MKRFRLLPAVLLAALTFNAMAAGKDDAGQIRGLLARTFDRPEQPLATRIVVVEGNHAVADWRQGDRGGRALLTRHAGGEWRIAYCGGANLRQAATLQASGMSPAGARILADRLVRAESALPLDDIRRMDAFHSEVRHHPDPGTAQQGHAHP